MESGEEKTIKAKVEVERSRPPVRDYTLWALLSLARDMIFKARTKELVSNGITPRQLAALLAIRSIGVAATPAEISRRLLREPHSVSGLLKTMIKDGLVSETKDLDRKNLTRVSLTKKGEEALALSMVNESLHRIFSPLSDGERLQLQSMLEILLTKAVEELDGRWHRDLMAFLERLPGRRESLLM